MKCEVVSDDYCKIFFNNLITEKLNFNNRDSIEIFLKNMILTLNNKYKIALKGIYQVKVFFNKKVGALIELEKVESFFSRSQEIEISIKIIFDCKFYFKTKEFFLVQDFDDIYYYNNNYYIDASKIKNIPKLIEFGNILEAKDFDVEEFGIKVEKV